MIRGPPYVTLIATVGGRYVEPRGAAVGGTSPVSRRSQPRKRNSEGTDEIGQKGVDLVTGVSLR